MASAAGRLAENILKETGLSVRNVKDGLMKIVQIVENEVLYNVCDLGKKR
jgi:hypothetical protein